MVCWAWLNENYPETTGVAACLGHSEVKVAPYQQKWKGVVKNRTARANGSSPWVDFGCKHSSVKYWGKLLIVAEAVVYA